MRAQNRGDPADRIELVLLVRARLVAGPLDPEEIDVGAESLRGAPGAANESLGSGGGLDQRQQPLSNRLCRGALGQPIVAPADRVLLQALRLDLLRNLA